MNIRLRLYLANKTGLDVATILPEEKSLAGYTRKSQFLQ